MKKLLLILALFIFNKALAYEIKGKLEIKDQWQPVIYLASINTPANLFVASPEFIINQVPINADGSFNLNGEDLPDDLRFYRLYIVQNQFTSVEFYNLPVRNFMHLVINNKSQIELKGTDPESVFESVLILNSELNTRLHEFENGYYQKKTQLDEGNTKAKRDFLNLSLNKYIRDFTINCRNALLGLFAIYHIEDKETDFLRNSNYYFDFQKRLKKEYPKSLYTNTYDELLDDLIGYREIVCEIPELNEPWKDWLIVGESILIVVLLIFLLRKRNLSSNNINTNKVGSLSEKEKIILENMAKGKANKEIAADLFIELSTVKTHINSIYKKLGAANRTEAVEIFRSGK